MLRVLLIEEDEALAARIGEMLSNSARAGPLDPRVDLTIAETLGAGLNHLRHVASDLLIVDLTLHDSHPADTFVRVRATEAELPIIVLTEPGDTHWPVQALTNGAQDYLVKTEFDGILLRRSIRYATDRWRLLSEVLHSRLRDEASGLLNRNGFFLFADRLVKAVSRSEGIWLLVARVEGLGPSPERAGLRDKDADRRLGALGRILRGAVREADVIARLSHDEFAVMLVDVARDGLELVTSRLDQQLKDHNRRQQRAQLPAITLALGTARLEPPSAYTLDQLLARASDALHAEAAEPVRRLGAPTGAPAQS
jgi:diguanylate cyclase (GGDEF)-like protein